MKKKFNWEDWREVSFIYGRLATEADFAAGTAVFYVDGDMEIFSEIPLPSKALMRKDDQTEEMVVIVQTEKQLRPTSGETVIVGYRNPDGTDGIGTLAEFTIIETNA